MNTQTAPNIYQTIRKCIIPLLGIMILFLFGQVQETQADSLLALTLTVNSANDGGGDNNPGNGVCQEIAGTACTLRAAIEEINAYNVTNPGTHTINFNIAGAGPHTIMLNAFLPRMEAPTRIMGSSQPGASCPTAAGDPADLKIIIDGTNIDYTNLITAQGLIEIFLDGSGSTIQGLVLNNYSAGNPNYKPGIYMNISTDNWIYCNYIGLDVDGVTERPLGVGILAYGTDNLLIGGNSQHTYRNVISGNNRQGISLIRQNDFYPSDNVDILNNYIGTDATGMTAVPNGDGIELLNIPNTQIGNTASLGGNVIAGNDGDGIYINGTGFSSAGAAGTMIQDNHIGVARDGVTPLGNDERGIWVRGLVSDVTIGGTGANAPNIIANNSTVGIIVEKGSSPSDIPLEITIRRNAIYDNGGLGIDLDPDSNILVTDGVTANDGAGDADAGPNTLLNFPELSNAFTDGSTVTFTFSYAGGTGFYTFDVYLNDSCDPSGHGEGETLVLESGFLTGGAGTTGGTTGFAQAGAAGKYLTSMVTFGNHSSEFSNCVAVADITSFLVNDSGDDGDFSTADNRCDTDGNAGNGHTCTLRAAIEQVNALSLSGAATVNFDIPGTGPHIIKLESELPDITKPILLDAMTQPGAECTQEEDPGVIMVQVDGANAGTAEGMTLATGSNGSLIRGFAFTNFSGVGVRVDSNNNTIQCNYIGLNPDGDTVEANGGTGLVISGDNNLIGGVFNKFRNVISGNIGNGISLAVTASNNDIAGNIIGLDAWFAQARGNTFQGIRVFGALGNDIGGTSADLGNYIGANTFNGIRFDAGSQSNDVWNNKIGVDRDGEPNVGNGTEGILLTDSDYNDIGFSSGGGAGNEIAGNGTAGIVLQVDSSNNQVWYNHIHDNTTHGARIFNGSDNVVRLNTIEDNNNAGIQVSDGAGNAEGNKLSQNSIYNNGDLGIDLDADNAVEPNDTLDPDTGANNQQNFPVLLLAADDLTVVGEFNSEASTGYTLEFFSSPTCDSSGHGEGQTYLDDWAVTTDVGGNANFTALLNASANVGDYITAVAYNTFTGDTSEFSACIQVVDAFIITHSDDFSDDNAGNGTCDAFPTSAGPYCTLRAAIEEVNALNAASKTVYSAIEGAGPHIIAPTSFLPSIDDTMILDALTYEEGADCETGLKLFVDGTAISGSTIDGLNITGSSAGTSITGLAIGNFPRSAIRVRTANVDILCNYLGLEADGKVLAPNLEGVTVVNNNTTIGSTTFPNVISGNTNYGIHIDGSAAARTGITIQGNTVGMTNEKNADVGNGLDGIYLNNVNNSTVEANFASGNNNHGIHVKDSDKITLASNGAGIDGTIEVAIGNSVDGIHLDNVTNSDILGGYVSGNSGDGIEIDGSDTIGVHGLFVGTNIAFDTAVPNGQGIFVRNGSSNINIGGIATNWISGNQFSGIRVDNSSFVDILDNNIGIGVLAMDLGNGTHGIWVQNSTDMQIGDIGMGNIIKFNGGAAGTVGIRITGASAVRNKIRGNSISDNVALGIDLNGDGVSLNDSGDGDGNANGTQNFPILYQAFTNSGGIGVSGNLNSIANQSYTIDFYRSASCDSSGYGEGNSFVGTFNVTTNSSSNGGFAGDLPAVPLGEFITAIVTDASGNSSEFSQCETVFNCAPPPVVDPTIAVVGVNIQLSWTADAGDSYQIYRAVNDPYFVSVEAYGSTSLGAGSWLDNDTNEVGDVAENHYYFVRATHSTVGCFSDVSKTVGEFDFAIVPGTP